MPEAYRAVPFEEVFAEVSPERQARIQARAAELIAEELARRDIRKARQVTQEEVARRLMTFPKGQRVAITRLRETQRQRRARGRLAA